MASPKSPLHSSALTLNGLTPGRTITWFGLTWGKIGTYVVCEYPRMGKDDYTGRIRLTVELKHVRYGYRARIPLTALGVVPYDGGGFHAQNFTLDHRKEYLVSGLPSKPAKAA